MRFLKVLQVRSAIQDFFISITGSFNSLGCCFAGFTGLIRSLGQLRFFLHDLRGRSVTQITKPRFFLQVLQFRSLVQVRFSFPFQVLQVHSVVMSGSGCFTSLFAVSFASLDWLQIFFRFCSFIRWFWLGLDFLLVLQIHSVVLVRFRSFYRSYRFVHQFWIGLGFFRFCSFICQFRLCLRIFLQVSQICSVVLVRFTFFTRLTNLFSSFGYGQVFYKLYRFIQQFKLG